MSGITSVMPLAGGKIVSPTGTLSITSSGSIGDTVSRLPLSTQVGAAVLSAAGDVLLTEDDGLNLTANLTGTGNLTVVNGSNTLAIVGNTSTSTGSINLSSAGPIALGATPSMPAAARSRSPPTPTA